MSDFKLLVHQAELDYLAGWVLEHPNDETGGDLFGFWTHSGSPTIQLVIGPGTRARHEIASFHQDRDHLENAGRHVQDAHGLQHIGDWHSHHRLGLRTPSGGDARTARRVFEYTEFPRFMLVIATIERGEPERPGLRQFMTRGPAEGSVVRVGAYLFERDRPDYRTGRWVVLPGTSPVGEAVRQDRVAGRPRRPDRRWQVPETTLDSPTGAPRAPTAGWYTTEQGSAFLRRFDERCREHFDGCRMSLDPELGELTYGFQTAGTAFAVRFPNGFPRHPAVVGTADGPTSLPTGKRSLDADATFTLLLEQLTRGTPDGIEHTEDENELEREPGRAPGAGTGDSEALLPQPALESSDRAGEGKS